MDDAAWAALTLSLTVLGGIWTWWSFRRRGLGSGLRGLGWTLLPLAAYLTRTLQLATSIADDVARWATHLVLSPVVWLGVVVAGLGVALIVVSGPVRARERGRRPVERPAAPAETGPGRGRPAITADDDMADIEALLRKRGIR